MFHPQSRNGGGGVQGCQNNLIHLVWTEQLVVLASQKLSITLKPGERFQEEEVAQRKDGVVIWSDLMQE